MDLGGAVLQDPAPLEGRADGKIGEEEESGLAHEECHVIFPVIPRPLL